MSDFLTALLANPAVAVATAIILVLLLVIVVILFVYAIWQGRSVTFVPPSIGPAPVLPDETEPNTTSTQIKGRRLFEHGGCYPVDIAAGTNIPTLNPERYVKALHHFLNQDNYDKLAAMDLIYLREDNLDEADVLPLKHHNEYNELLQLYELQWFKKNHSHETLQLFRNAIRVIDDLGDTLRGTHSEIILHDVRNPLKSVLKAKNTEGLSGRTQGDPSTRFVVEYLKHQGKHLEQLKGSKKVAYQKQFSKTKTVKATTTPLVDDRYGLIGILCFNIDTDVIKSFNDEDRDNFFDNYTKITGKTPEFEKDDAPIDPT